MVLGLSMGSFTTNSEQRYLSHSSMPSIKSLDRMTSTVAATAHQLLWASSMLFASLTLWSHLTHSVITVLHMSKWNTYALQVQRWSQTSEFICIPLKRTPFLLQTCFAVIILSCEGLCVFTEILRSDQNSKIQTFQVHIQLEKDIKEGVGGAPFLVILMSLDGIYEPNL